MTPRFPPDNNSNLQTNRLNPLPSFLLYVLLFPNHSFRFHKLDMRPQGLWRSLGLVQRSYSRAFIPAGPGRRSIRNLSSAPRVPDFAFAFE